MGISLSEMNCLVTRSDLLEFERKINQQFELVKEEFKKTRSFVHTSEKARENKQEYLSVSDFAKIVGRSWQTVKNWILSGIIEGAQPEGKNCSWVIPIGEIEKVRTMCGI